METSINIIRSKQQRDRTPIHGAAARSQSALSRVRDFARRIAPVKKPPEETEATRENEEEKEQPQNGGDFDRGSFSSISLVDDNDPKEDTADAVRINRPVTAGSIYKTPP